ncbi:Ig-like domain-containing protein [Idiomarina seosinensis]|uniref:Cadherin-like domain-containing protein n=1 Tax=Idiomarina seosinensis TaxID=281739 RepID=A0A432ZGG4_9GAMM|nr:Ig-like domain-containing protein [Idiomarina seosinensis]RUO76994.1 hypothetical protein CWI81_00355 [Idiomarina seosinensis]
MKKQTLALAIITALGVTACGSDNDGNNNQPEEPVNNAPETSADNASVVAGETHSIDVLGNDTDPDGDELTLSEVGTPENGTTALADGMVSYTANDGFQGEDTFGYTVSDGELTAQGTVTVAVNAPPTANPDSSEAESGESIAIDVLANDTDPGDELTITEVSSPSNGTAEVTDNQITYTPNDSYIGSDSFSYTVSDGELTAQAEVTLSVVDTVTVVGLVTDEPIPNATVVINVDGETFEVQADVQGRYELPVKLTSIDSDEIIRVTARGSEGENQGHVVLNSLLMSSADLIETAGGDGELTRDEFNDVNVTHVTTARDALIRKLAQDKELTKDNISTFGNAIDPQLLVQMAAVVKLLVDNPETYSLPEGYESVEDFLADEEQYNSFVEEVSQAPSGGGDSPLQQAINETLEDPEVMPELSMDDLYGRYAEMFSSTPFILSNSGVLWDIDESGIEYYPYRNESAPLHVSINGNRVVPDSDSSVLEESTSYVYLTEDDFPTEEAFDAWLAFKGWETFRVSQEEITTRTTLDHIDVISVAEAALTVKVNTTTVTSDVEFEYGGKTYTAKAGETQMSEYARQLLEVEAAMQTDLSFDIKNGDTWFLPLADTLDARLGVFGGVYEFSGDGTFNVKTYSESEPAQGYRAEYFSGTWSLSEDAKTLSVITATGQFGAHFTRYGNDTGKQGVIMEYIVAGERSGYAQIRDGGKVEMNSLPFAALESAISGDLLLTSVLNFKAPRYWDGDSLLPIDVWSFDFDSDGEGSIFGGALCDGSPMDYQDVCRGQYQLNQDQQMPITWELTSTNDFEQVLGIDREPYGPGVNQRYWLPVAVSEQSILSVIEWNYYDVGYDQPGLLMPPRMQRLFIQEKPEVGTPMEPTELKQNYGSSNQPLLNVNSLSGYKVVNPQGLRVGGQSRN